jgi:hypothetical protein
MARNGISIFLYHFGCNTAQFNGVCRTVAALDREPAAADRIATSSMPAHLRAEATSAIQWVILPYWVKYKVRKA